MSTWIKTRERLPPRNVPVLAAWNYGAAWQYDVAKFGGKRWLEVVPQAANEEFSPPDYWREIEPPGAELETRAEPDKCRHNMPASSCDTCFALGDN